LIIRAGTCCLLVEALHNFFVSQEFMILPTGAATFAEALQMGAEVYHNLKVACSLPLVNVCMHFIDVGGKFQSKLS
jgi:enolase